jgi:putative ABC transport system substrate-binding protein
VELRIRWARHLRRRIDAAFAEVATWHAQALAVSPGVAKQRVAELALRQCLPSASFFREGIGAGVLLSVGVLPSEADLLFIRSADIADRLLRGANPADIPVKRPSHYELVINMKTAKALGLTIPQSLLLRADR